MQGARIKFLLRSSRFNEASPPGYIFHAMRLFAVLLESLKTGFWSYYNKFLNCRRDYLQDRSTTQNALSERHFCFVFKTFQGSLKVESTGVIRPQYGSAGMLFTFRCAIVVFAGVVTNSDFRFFPSASSSNEETSNYSNSPVLAFPSVE